MSLTLLSQLLASFSQNDHNRKVKHSPRYHVGLFDLDLTLEMTTPQL